MRRLTYAKESHIAGLQRLWMEAFGDEEEYIRSFLTFQIRDRFSYVILEEEEENSVIAMAHVFPCKIRTPLADYEFAYLYAVATLKSHQGRGIASEMLVEIHRDLRKKGFFGTFLFPADQDLFRYYAKRGYHLKGYAKQFELGYTEVLNIFSNQDFKPQQRIEGIRQLKCEEIHESERLHYAERLNTIKNLHYQGYNYEYWDEKHSEFMLYDSAYEKKRIMFFRCDKKECFLIWKMREGNFMISEIAIEEEGFKNNRYELMRSIIEFQSLYIEKGDDPVNPSKAVFKFTLPYWFEEGRDMPKAMICSFDKQVEFITFMPNNSL